MPNSSTLATVKRQIQDIAFSKFQMKKQMKKSDVLDQGGEPEEVEAEGLWQDLHHEEVEAEGLWQDLHHDGGHGTV